MRRPMLATIVGLALVLLPVEVPAQTKTLVTVLLSYVSQAWLAARKDPKGASEAYNQVFEKKDPAYVRQHWGISSRWLNSSSTRLRPTGWMSDADWQALVKRIQLLDARPDPLKPKPVGEYYTNEFINCK